MLIERKTPLIRRVCELCIAVLVQIGPTALAHADEMAFAPPVEFPEIEGIDLWGKENKVYLILSRTSKEWVPKKEFSVRKFMILTLFNDKLSPIATPYSGGYAFEPWQIICGSEIGMTIIGADVSGRNPLDRPNNPLPRLWLLDLQFSKEPTTQRAFPFAVGGQAHAANEPLESNSRISSGYVNVGGTMPSVDKMSCCMTSVDGGVCFGLSRQAAWGADSKSKDRDVLWFHDFTLRPFEWSRKGSRIEGSFAKIASGLSEGDIFVAYLDSHGRLGILRKQAHQELAKGAHDEFEINDKCSTTQFVSIQSIRDTSSRVALLEDGEYQCKLHILGYLAKIKKWRTMRVVAVRRSREISVLAMKGFDWYAYLSREKDETKIQVGNIALSDDFNRVPDK